jgi:hypothetical protein
MSAEEEIIIKATMQSLSIKTHKLWATKKFFLSKTYYIPITSS